MEGLADNRFALIFKNHHALVDGIAGIDLATALFDLSPEPPPIRHSTGRAWSPRPEPSAADLLATALRGAVRTEARLAAGLVDALSNPERTLGRAREAAEGIGEVLWAFLNPAPPTPLNVEIGPYRRFVAMASTLDDFKLVKDTFGGTVNDAVLSVVTGALRTLLISRGVRTSGLELRALVPVSVRSAGEHNQMGNRIVAIRGALPVYIADPLERLRYISAEMADLKESKQALGAKVITEAQNFAPPTCDQRPRSTGSPVCAAQAAAARLPRRLPALRPRPGDRDHVLQRRDELRLARRFRGGRRHRRDWHQRCR